MVKSSISNVLLLIAAIGICLSAGVVGSVFTAPAVPGWYDGLQKPDFNPPSWVFGPVWTVLYILMGITLYLIIQAGITNRQVLIGAVLFALQLLLNAGWSYLFFGLHSPLYGLVGIIALWAVLLCTIIQVIRFSVVGGVILIPYFVWVTFAAFLNYTIMIMNPV